MSTRLNQIALSVRSRSESSEFYSKIFGVEKVGETDAFTGAQTDQVQGMANSTSVVNWHMDDRPYFQLELFEFSSPKPVEFATRRLPQDVGYSRIALEVSDIEAIHDKCREANCADLSDVMQIEGRAYFCMKDPNGILVEVGQSATAFAGNHFARLCGIALTVPDMQQAVKSFRDGAGCPLHSDAPIDKGLLWGEENANKSITLLDGTTVWLELSVYQQPNSKPWPENHKLNDIGILNIAIGFDRYADFASRLNIMQENGFKANCEPVGPKNLFHVTYSNDPQGFSVETLLVGPLLYGALGFKKQNLFDRLLIKLIKATN